MKKHPNDLVKDILGKSVNAIHYEGLSIALKSLSEKEQQILDMRYNEGKTLKQIGEIFGVTDSAIQQKCERALRRLRHPARRNTILHGSTSERIKRLEELKSYENRRGKEK